MEIYMGKGCKPESSSSGVNFEGFLFFQFKSTGKVPGLTSWTDMNGGLMYNKAACCLP